MNLREFNSNSKEFLDQIPQEDVDRRSVIKVLGIEWSTYTDSFKLGFSYDSSKISDTKRGVLKSTASIYDPCGFAAPFLLPAKLLLQELRKN